MLAPTVLHRTTILVVDDEEQLRRLVAQVLEDDGYRVITARDGRAALALLQHPGPPVQLVVTDVSMPNMSGPELAGVLRADPAAPAVLFMSGETNGTAVPGPILSKPFLPSELSRVVQEMLNGKHREPEEKPEPRKPWKGPDRVRLERGVLN
jgi:CheY-like chemotaxis protein